MLKEEKLRAAVQYAAENYGNHTLIFLQTFRTAFGLAVETVNLDGVLVKRLDSGDIKTEGDESQHLALKQFVLANAIAKLATLMESIAALWIGMREPLRLPDRMMSYQTRTLRNFIKRAADRNIDARDVWEVLAFPDVGLLPITSAERVVLERTFHSSVGFVTSTLADLAGFYLANQVVYSKLKHGLTFVPGFAAAGPMPAFCAILDHETRPELPMVTVRSEEIGGVSPWFGEVTLLPYDESGFGYYGDLIVRMSSLVANILDGHFARIANCGLDYVPPRIMVESAFPGPDWESFAEIVEREILPNQAVANIVATYNFNFGPESVTAIRNQFRERHVANLNVAPGPGEFSGPILRAKHEFKIERVSSP